MTTDPLRRITTRSTPQNRPATPAQVRNNAGGYVFETTLAQRVRRFLVLGVAGGTYHVAERELALDNAQAVIDMASGYHHDLVDLIIEVSESGAAPRVEPALFALAIASTTGTTGSNDERNYAFRTLARVARIPTHLFIYLNYLKQFKNIGGNGLKRALRRWYLDKPVSNLAYHAVKYRQRDGWTHRDVLRLSKPKTTDADRDTLFAWIAGKTTFDDSSAYPTNHPLRIVEGYERIQHATTDGQAARLIRAYQLPWEAVPDQFINKTSTWEALLEVGVPQTALMRQLPRLTNLGMLSPLGSHAASVAAQLQDQDRLTRARVHPMNVLIANTVYAGGYSFRGRQTWSPSRPIVEALTDAFYNAFGAVTPTNQRMLLALDVSGSMTHSRIADTNLTPRMGAAAMALVTANVESMYDIIGFTGSSQGQPGRYNQTDNACRPLSISPRQRIGDVVNYMNGLSFGRTDCAQPMLYATRNNLEIDTFVIYTDAETWHGSVHPFQALRDYRQRTGIAARLVVVGMVATGFTIADPNDPGMLDVVGFDTGTPQLISDFSQGKV